MELFSVVPYACCLDMFYFMELMVGFYFYCIDYVHCKLFSKQIHPRTNDLKRFVHVS